MSKAERNLDIRPQGPESVFNAGPGIWMQRLLVILFLVIAGGLGLLAVGVLLVNGPSLVRGDAWPWWELAGSTVLVAGWLWLIVRTAYRIMLFFPDVGISHDAFWFRPFLRWNRLAWSDVEAIEQATRRSVPFPEDWGLLVYSHRLPRAYASVAFMFGPYRGRAVCVSSRLPDFVGAKSVVLRRRP